MYFCPNLDLISLEQRLRINIKQARKDRERGISRRFEVV